MPAHIIPTFRYHDAPAAIEFLCRAFGFEKHAVYEGEAGTVAHAQLVLGDGMIMLGSAGDGEFDALQKPADGGRPVSSSPYIVVSDPDALHTRAVEAGAEVVMALHDADYGGSHVSFRDPQGQLWNFGSYDPWSSDQ